MRIGLSWSRRSCAEGMKRKMTDGMICRQKKKMHQAQEGRSMPRLRSRENYRESTGERPGVRPFARIRKAVKPIGYFSKIYAEDLPHRAKAVYMYLKDRSDKNGQCYPAIGTIAKEIHLSRRTVERAIEDLICAGFIKKEQRWRKNGGRSSLLYTLTDNG